MMKTGQTHQKRNPVGELAWKTDRNPECRFTGFLGQVFRHNIAAIFWFKFIFNFFHFFL
jgi:hypothetical protein